MINLMIEIEMFIRIKKKKQFHNNRNMNIQDKNNYKNNKYFKLNRIKQMKEIEKEYFKLLMINREKYKKIKGIRN